MKKILAWGLAGVLLMMGAAGRAVEEEPASILLAAYPTGTSGESYLIELFEDGHIRTQMGDRVWDAPLGEDFFREVLEEAEGFVEPMACRRLWAGAAEVFAREELPVLELWTDSWVFALRYGEQEVRIDMRQTEYEALWALCQAIIEASPMEMDLHGWA